MALVGVILIILGIISNIYFSKNDFTLSVYSIILVILGIMIILIGIGEKIRNWIGFS